MSLLKRGRLMKVAWRQLHPKRCPRAEVIGLREAQRSPDWAGQSAAWQDPFWPALMLTGRSVFCYLCRLLQAHYISEGLHYGQASGC